jgi:RimJ/RimL family protein N-acetyltransferase
VQDEEHNARLFATPLSQALAAKIMSRPPRLRTPRLILRQYSKADFEHFAALNCNAEARRHMDGPLNRMEAAERFERFLTDDENGVEAWAVTLASTGRFTGHAFVVGLENAGEAEVGFILDPEVWRRGYGSEVARAVVAYGLEQKGYSRIMATVDTDHLASIKVLGRAGMVFEREIKDRDGTYFVYARRREVSRKESLANDS